MTSTLRAWYARQRQASALEARRVEDILLKEKQNSGEKGAPGPTGSLARAQPVRLEPCGLMLGLASYQEALRALGRLTDQASELRIVEDSQARCLEIATPGWNRRLGGPELEEVVVTSVARRGEHRPAGDSSDVLRSVGRALDELQASDVCLVLSPDHLNVRFWSDHRARSHELTYDGDELDALRRSAAARRNGQPLRRILILQATTESAGPVAELLVAEFAVQALPTLYARAIAATSEPPDLVLAPSTPEAVEAVRTLRSGSRTAGVPIVVLASEDSTVAPDDLFSAGADDFLQQPVQPAQLRARVRTWLLRGRPSLHSA
jgi:CheY-like chemotaxis protein